MDRGDYFELGEALQFSGEPVCHVDVERIGFGF